MRNKEWEMRKLSISRFGNSMPISNFAAGVYTVVVYCEINGFYTTFSFLKIR
jgi:hypothetical protein